MIDHGLDSYSAALIPAAMFSIFGRGSQSISPLRMYYILWNVFVNFYLSHFEKYNTGVLFLPWGYDFSMIVSIFVLYKWNYCVLIWKLCLSGFGVSIFTDSNWWTWSVEIYVTWRHYSWSAVRDVTICICYSVQLTCSILEYLQVSIVFFKIARNK